MFNLLKKKNIDVSDKAIVAVVDGEIIPTETIADETFAQSMMGKTIAIEPSNGNIVSPCNGKIELIFPTGHAFGVRMKDGTGIIVHIGIDTVKTKGDGFKVLKKQGDDVKAGEPVVKVDLDKLKKLGYILTAMTIISEPIESRLYSDKNLHIVKKGDILIDD